MRPILLTLTLSCAALAATPAQTTTYVDGNVTGLAANTGGTLAFDDEKAMVLRTGLTTVSVPYGSVSQAELGAVKENAPDKPFYKFWSRRHKSETQLLIVNFKDDQGAERNMTLELAQPAAQTVLNDLESRTGKQFVASSKPLQPAAAAKTAAPKPAGDWWGDQYWKTPRNADKWPKPPGSTDQQ